MDSLAAPAWGPRARRKHWIRVEFSNAGNCATMEESTPLVGNAQ